MLLRGPGPGLCGIRPRSTAKKTKAASDLENGSPRHSLTFRGSNLTQLASSVIISNALTLTRPVACTVLHLLGEMMYRTYGGSSSRRVLSRNGRWSKNWTLNWLVGIIQRSLFPFTRDIYSWRAWTCLLISFFNNESEECRIIEECLSNKMCGIKSGKRFARAIEEIIYVTLRSTNLLFD